MPVFIDAPLIRSIQKSAPYTSNLTTLDQYAFNIKYFFLKIYFCHHSISTTRNRSRHAEVLSIRGFNKNCVRANAARQQLASLTWQAAAESPLSRQPVLTLNKRPLGFVKVYLLHHYHIPFSIQSLQGCRFRCDEWKYQEPATDMTAWDVLTRTEHHRFP